MIGIVIRSTLSAADNKEAVTIKGNREGRQRGRRCGRESRVRHFNDELHQKKTRAEVCSYTRETTSSVAAAAVPL